MSDEKTAGSRRQKTDWAKPNSAEFSLPRLGFHPGSDVAALSPSSSLITHHSSLTSQHSGREAWRLIPPTAFDGPENMAIDEALLTLIGDGASPPTLRFYTWRSPWISLGTSQSARDLDATALAVRGWGVLRRSSGGTAVLHKEQLGYAVILPASHPLWEGDLASSYRRLAEPLALGFARLGARTEPAPPALKAEFAAEAPPIAARVCFSALGPYELLDCHGRKIIGNSQVRRRASALQHGTIQVSGSQCEIADVLANATATDRCHLRSYLSTHVGSVEEAAGRRLATTDVVEALTAAFEEVLGVRLVDGELTDDERRVAAELVEAKYGDPNWAFRR